MPTNQDPASNNFERSATRRLISLTLGVLMAAGGAFAFVWMLFHVVEPIKAMFWMAPVVVSVIGLYIIWDDIQNP
ncbi:hypothetical protein [Shinella sp.]|uniref:hypothetical protein n=1 Tax=Shinella sp. TaxID=1870904 RepID=UPI0028A77886|nr:hypothetical protein [Shinella sp.]